MVTKKMYKQISSVHGSSVVTVMQLLLLSFQNSMRSRASPERQKKSNRLREVASSETQEQLVGAGKSLNGREKNSGEEYVA